MNHYKKQQMKLVLSNFRCYTDETFEFPLSGLTLIKGVSGVGKSSLFNAIVFALYGNLIHPYTYGATSCSVTLENSSLDISVTRTCKPNRLIVKHKGKTFEDDAAQGIINKIYGMTAEEFQVSSHFNQDNHGSILSLAPREQLLFIERIAGLTEEYEEDRTKIKERIQFLETEQTKIRAQASLFDDLLEQRKSNLQDANIVDEGNPVFNIDELKELNNTTLKQLNTIQSQLKTKRNLVVKLRLAETAQKETEDSKFKIQTELDNFTALRDALGEIESEETIEKTREKAEDLRTQASNIRKFKDALKLEIELETIKKEHIDKLNTELAALTQMMLSPEELLEATTNLEKYEETRKLLDDQERLVKETEIAKDKATVAITEARSATQLLFKLTTKTAIKSVSTNTTLVTFLKKKVKDLTQNLAKVTDQLTLAKSKCWECPKCNVPLFLSGDVLSERKGKIPDNIPALETENLKVSETLNECNTLLQTVDENITILNNLPQPVTTEIACMTMKELQYVSAKVLSQKDISKNIADINKQLSTRVFPKSAIRLRNEIKEKRAGIPKNLDIQLEPESIESCAKQLETENGIAWRNRGDYSKFTREINTRQKTIDAVKKKFVKSNEPEQKLSADVEKEIMELEKDMVACNDRLQTLQKDLSCLSLLNEYKKAKEDVEKLQSKEEVVFSHLQGIYAVEKASKIAHMQTLVKTINNINEHAKIYLDQMFPDHPIIVKLEIKTHTKKGDIAANLTIGTRIDYKGVQDVHIPSLSVGERQRINLSLLLGVNDLFGSSILLLDECLNNLHSEIHTETLGFLKDLCPAKQILVISHEEITGIFDNVIEL